MSLETQFGDRQIQPYLGGLLAGINNMGDPQANRKPLTLWGEYMLVRTDALFATGSRDGVVWPRLKPSTKASRRLNGISGSNPLDATGDMRKSIRFFVSPALGGGLQTRVYSNHGRIGIHHKGATIPAHEVKAKNAKALRFAIGGKVIFARKASIPEVTIPARPVLFISERDRQTAVRYVREHRLKLLRDVVVLNNRKAA